MGRAAAGVGRERVLETALELFAERGVAGTSLQMIAAELGRSKAAIYHHFPAKDLIVLEVLHPGLAQLDEVVAEADLADDPAAKAEVVVRGLADIMVRHRRRYSVMMGDPAVAPVLAADPHTADTFVRMEAALLGPAPDLRRRITVRYFLAALDAPAREPLRSDPEFDDDTVHTSVLRLWRRLVEDA